MASGDLAAIVAMGTRADHVQFHLDRDVDFIQCITRAGDCWRGWERRTHIAFFIDEEGTTAAAYVIVSVFGDRWTLEEGGDRDACGARVGALLQALIARAPVERRPTIRAWLPAGFLPPQVAVASTMPSTETIRVRLLGSRASAPPLCTNDVLFLRNDLL